MFISPITLFIDLNSDLTHKVLTI